MNAMTVYKWTLLVEFYLPAGKQYEWVEVETVQDSFSAARQLARNKIKAQYRVQSLIMLVKGHKKLAVQA